MQMNFNLMGLLGRQSPSAADKHAEFPEESDLGFEACVDRTCREISEAKPEERESAREKKANGQSSEMMSAIYVSQQMQSERERRAEATAETDSRPADWKFLVPQVKTAEAVSSSNVNIAIESIESQTFSNQEAGPGTGWVQTLHPELVHFTMRPGQPPELGGGESSLLHTVDSQDKLDTDPEWFAAEDSRRSVLTRTLDDFPFKPAEFNKHNALESTPHRLERAVVRADAGANPKDLIGTQQFSATDLQQTDNFAFSDQHRDQTKSGNESDLLAVLDSNASGANRQPSASIDQPVAFDLGVAEGTSLVESDGRQASNISNLDSTAFEGGLATRVISQLVDQLPLDGSWLYEGAPERRLRVQIFPEELGQLEITVTKSGDGLSAQIAASELLTSELLVREREQLATALAEKGFELPDIDISYRNQQGSSRDEQHQEHFGQPSTEWNASSARIPTDRSRSSRSSLVDVLV